MATVARLAAAVVLTAAATLVSAGAAGPSAYAATCSTANGVTVVVDFNELGGGVRTACDGAGGGKTAAALFPDNGFPLEYVQRTPGFVCRVSGVPADDPCVNTPPTNAYWGLWWSDGRSGTWSYASQGAGSLTIPEGGYVAFSWDGSDGSAPPSATPTKRTAPSSSPTPQQQPSAAPPKPPATSGGGAPAAPATSAPASAAAPVGTPAPSEARRSSDTTEVVTPTAEPNSGKSPRTRSKPDRDEPTSATETPGEGTSDVVPVGAERADADAGGLPGWVAPVLIGLLFAGAAGAGVVRRRRATGS